MMGSVRSAGWALLGTRAPQRVWFDFVVFQGTGEPVFVPPERPNGQTGNDLPE